MTKRARETIFGPHGAVIGGQTVPDNDPRVTDAPGEFDDVATAGTGPAIAYDTDAVPYLTS